MALSIGILLGVLAKKRKKGLSRLRQFRQKLLKQNKTEAVLYQIPAKLIFSILFIIILTIFLQWFLHHHNHQLQSHLKNQQITFPSLQSIKKVSASQLQKLDDYVLNQKLNQQEVAKSQLQSLRKFVFYIQGLFCIFLSILITMLNLKMVKINKKQSKVVMTNYCVYRLQRSSQRYNVKQKDRIQIWMIGEDRFTNTNYYYSIVIVDSDGHCEIIQKSNLFDARTAVITIGVTLDIPYSVKVINKISNPI